MKKMICKPPTMDAVKEKKSAASTSKAKAESKKKKKAPPPEENESSSGIGMLIALEPRIMFDGAALATGAEVLQDTTTIDQTVIPGINEETATDSTTTENADDALWSSGLSLTAPSDRKEIVFIDTSVDDFQTLLEGIDPNAEVILLDSTRDGIEQIAEILGERTDIDAVHIISHGGSGELRLGTGVLDLASMQGEYADELATINQALTEEADFLIYGCNFGEGASGHEAATLLAELTGADIAASDDLTGSTELGGDWDLEVQTGTIESEVIVDEQGQEDFAGVLDITTGLVGNWTFDADATDSSGNNYDGTLTNGATIDTTDATDQVGAGKLSVNGIDDYLDLSSHVSSFDGLTEGTISVWVYADGNSTGTIFSASDSGDADSSLTIGRGSDGSLEFYLAEGPSILMYAYTSADDIPLHTWTHVAVTVESSGNKFYINGSQVTGGNLTYSTGSASTNSFFDDVTQMDFMAWGVDSSPSSYEFDGLIDDGRVYNRALTSTDIAELATEAPVANDDSATTNMDTAVNIDLTANDTDLDSETITVLDVGNPTNGTVINNEDGTVTYTPTTSYTGADSFTYLTADLDDTTSYWRLDGDATDAVGSNDGTITGTTTVEGHFGDALSFDEVDDKVVVSDFAINNEFSLSFKIKIDDNTGSLFQYIYSHGDVATTNSLNVFLNEASHGTDPNMLRTVIRDTNDTLDNFALQFDASSIIGDGNWHTYTLTVAAGEGAKVYLDGVVQNTDATRGGDAFDPGTDLYLGTRHDEAADRWYGGSLDSVQVFNRALSAAEANDTHTGGSSLGTVSLTISDAPVITNLGSDNLAYTEGDGAVVIDQGTAAAVTDSGSSDFDTGTLTVSFQAGSDSAEDVLAIQNQGTGAGQIGVSGSNVTYNFGAGAVTIGTFTGGTSGTDLVITLNASADAAAVSALTQNITYENTDTDNPTTTARMVRYVLTDGDGGTSANYDTTVTVSGVNDAPVNTVPGPQVVAEDTALNISGLSVTDVDGNLSTVQLAVTQGTVNVTLSGSATISAGGNGTSTLTLSGTQADINATLASLSYQGTLNYNGADSLTMTSTDGNSATDVDAVAITVTGVNDAPVAAPDSYNLLEDGSLTTTLLPAFTEQVITNTANGAHSVVAADVDGDGDLDVLAASDNGDTVAWFENTDGLGTFGAEQVITNLADGAFAVTAADVDGDGDLDVLAASTNDDTVAWYENTDGLGTFGTEQVLTNTADGAYSIVATDVDGDGDLDVLAASKNDDTVAWYENTDGLGTFGAEQVITNTADGAVDVTAADVDGDGDQDVLVASLIDDTVAWYENTDGLGTFGAEQVIDNSANGARSVTTADVDGDGDLDVVAAIRVSDTVVWYENTDGLGTFGSEQVINNTTNGPSSVMAADVDGDGDLDVVAASVFGDTVAWFENTDGLGTFGAAQVLTNTADGAISVAIADVDGDGDLDVLAASGGDDTVAWFENNDPGVLYNDTDADADPLTAVLVTDVSNGTLVLNANGTFTYTPDANFNGVDSFTYKANDGTVDGNTVTVTLNVTAVNDVPVITNVGGDMLAYTEGDGAAVIEQGADAAVSDVDNSDFDTGTLTVSFQAGSDSAEDVLAIQNQGTGAGQIGVSGSNVTYNFGAGAVTIGTFTGGTSGTDLVITLNASADAAAVSALTQNITYENTDTDNPTTTARMVRYVLTDGDGGTSANYDTTVTVSGVNDAPVNTVPGPQAVAEDTALNISGLSVTDVDGNLSTVQLAVTQGTVNVTLSGAASISAGGNGTSTLTLSGTQADINATLASLSYQGTLNYNGADTLTMTSTDGNSATDVDAVAITVTGVNDAPVAAPDSYTLLEDGSLTTTLLPSFTEQVVITNTANGAISVTTADVDGDGDLDLLAASQSDDTVAWFENTDGLGTFGAEQVITNTANWAVDVTAADVDGDGDLDVLAASAVDDTVAWFENTDGLGTFGAEQVITNTADAAWAVTAADVDGDGDLDVLAASFADDTVAWFENTDGLGTFGAEQVITNTADSARSVTTADVDGDGDLDVLAASIGDDTVAWFENTDGLGTFGAEQVITNTADGVYSVTAADVDGDGDLDVLAASENDDTVAWFENTDGLGTFGTEQVITNTADGTHSVTAADMDGDGDLDVLAASFNDDTVAWFENTDGLGTFGAEQVITNLADGAIAVTAADVDGDGDLDVLTASFNDDTVAWFENTDGGALTNDTDLDGDPLTVVLVTDVNNGTLVLNANGTFTYTPDANFNGVDSFTYKANDGTVDGNTVTVTLNVTAVNDVPTITNLGGDMLAYTEGDGAAVIEQGADAAVSDVDNSDFDTGTLTVSFQAGSDSAEDVLAIQNQGTGAGQIGVSGSNVTYNFGAGAVTIGMFTGGTSGTDLVITLNASADAAAVSALTQNITYENTDTDNPTTTARTVRYVLTDGDGGTSANYDTTVTVSGVNDAPVNTVPGAQVVAEDTALALTGISVNDVDGNLSTVQLAVTNGTLNVTLSGAASISAGGNGTSTLTLSGTQADINATLASLSYQGTLNYTGADMLTMTSTDGNSATDVDVVAITVSGVNDAPTDLTTDTLSIATDQVNTSEVGDQTDVKTTALSGGGYVVVWNDNSGLDGSVEGVFAQVYDASGAPVGSQIQVNTHTTDAQFVQSVTGLQSGGFVVGLQGERSGDWYSTFRVFDAAGVPAGSEIDADIYGYRTQITQLQDGNLFIAYVDTAGTDDMSFKVVDLAGNEIVGETRIATIANWAPNAFVEVLSTGDVAVTWRDGATNQAMLRVYQPDGTALGAAVAYGGTNTLGSFAESVSLAATTNGLVTVYEDSGNVFAQFWDNDGSVNGSAVMVYSDADVQSAPNVVHLADGTFFVTWQSANQDGSGLGVYGQHLMADGTPIGTAQRINDVTVGDQGNPEVIQLTNGDLRVVWESENVDSDGFAIVQKTLSFDGYVNEGAAFGTVVTQVTSVADPDSGDSHIFTLLDDAGGAFDINGGTGEITVANGALIDFESTPTMNVTVRVTDAGGLTYDEVVTIQVIDINEVPVNTVPGPQAVAEDTALNISGLSVTDVDGNLSTVQLAVTQGTVNVTVSGSATISAGGNGTSTLTLSGTQADINATLASLSYQGTLNYSGADTLTMTSTDGNSATDVDVVAITVTGVNDAPVNTVPGPQAVAEDTALNISGLSVTDVDGNLSTVQLAVTQGTVNVTLSGAASISAGGNGTSTLTLSGTQADINATLASLSYQGTLNYSGADTLTMTSTDGNSATDVDVVAITVTGVNDAPVNTVPGPQAVAEDTALNISGLSVTDVDGNLSTVQLAVTQGTVNVTVSGSATISAGGNGTSTLTLSGTQADINATLASLSYQGTLNYSGADTLTMTSTDGNSATDVDVVAITVTGVNDAPVNTVPGPQAVAEDTALNISGLSVTDVDGNLSTVQLAVTQGTVNVTLSGAASISAGGNGTSTLTLSGTQADINATLASLSYQGTLNYSGADTLTMTSTDGNSATDVDVVAITVTGVNDAPVNTVPGPQAVAEDTALNISGLSVTDVDGNLSTVQLAVTQGTVNVTVSGSATISAGGNGTSTLTLSGTQADINATLASLSYQGTLNYSGADTLTMTSTDGNSATDVDVVAITVTGVNDAPVNTVPGPQAVAEDTALNISGLSVTDVDGNLSTVQLAVTQGTVNVTLSGAASISAGGNGTSTLTLSGTQADINATLASLSYQGTLNYSGADTLTMTSTDGNSATDVDVVAITVTGVNDAPVNTVPGPQAVAEDTALNISGLSVTDVDGNLSTVQLAVTQGTVNVTVSGSATISAGGNGTSTLTLSGTQADINATLASLSYQGTLNYSGADTLTMTSTDGNSATDVDVVAITVTGVNDAPVNTVPGPQAVAEDTALNISGLSVTDVDGNLSTVQLAVTQGTVNVTLSGAASISAGGNGTSTLTLSGTQADINATLASLSYQGTLNYSGADTLTMTSTDGNSATDVDVVAITVTGVNDAPVNTVPGPQAVAEDTALNISGLSVTDVDGNLSTVQLAVTQGTVNVTVSGSATISAGGNGTSTLTLSGTQADINATLASLSYQGTLNYSGADTLTMTSTDGNSATDVDVVAITVTGVNDAPVNTVPGPQAVAEDTALNISGLSVTDVDGNLSTVQLAVTQGTVNVTLSGAASISAGGNGTSTLTLSGTQADINATLASLSYQGTLNYTGADSLTMTSTDANSATDVDVVAITVTGVNDVPIAINDSYTTAEDTTLATTLVTGVLANDNDVDFDTLTVNTTPVANVTNGTLVLNADGSFTYTPANGWSGVDTFTYQISDGNGGSAQATVTLTVVSVNDAPVITSHGGGGNVALGMAENLSGVTTMTATDSNGDPLTYSIVGGADAARFTVDSTTGALSFVGVPDFENPTDVGGNNVYDVQVQVSDGQGGTDTQSLAISVTDVMEGMAPPPPGPTPEPIPEPMPEPEPEIPGPLPGETANTGSVSGYLDDSGLAGRGPEEGEHLTSHHEVVNVLDLPPLLRPASWATTSDQIRAYYPDPLDMTKTGLSSEVLQQLNQFSDELGQTMEDQAGERSWFSNTIKSVGLTLSAGFVAWMVRGGALVAGLMASLPAWRHFDPVPILNMNKQEKEAWSRRVKDAATLDAHEHHGLDQILQGKTEEGPKATVSAKSEAPSNTTTTPSS